MSEHDRVTRRIVYGGIIASVVLNSFLTLVGRGNFLQFLVVLAAVFFIGIPALVVAACTGSVRWLARLALLAVAVSVSVFATFVTGVVIAAVFLIVIPALVFAACAWGRSLRRVGPVAMLVAAVSLSTLVSLFTGYALAKRDIAQMQHYCESLAPGLDEYKREQGAYPRELSLLPRKAPSYFYIEYSSDGSEFTMNFFDPRPTLDVYYYNSKTRTWRVQH